MAKEVLMPRQGNTVESCIILEWKKKAGDAVSEGEVICEVETDKATFEVEAPEAGTLLAVLYEEGADVPVLTPIAVIGKQGEDVSSLVKPAGSHTPGGVAANEAGSGVTAASTGLVDLPRKAQKSAPAAGKSRKIAISPRARKLAEREGFDYATLAGRGSGPSGRIIERDISGALSSGAAAVQAGPAKQAAAAVASQKTPAPAGSALPDFPGPMTTRPLSGVRKLIAERMYASLQQSAQLTMHAYADARAILSFRKRLKASSDKLGIPGITINAIMLFAAVRALRNHPAMNAVLVDGSIREFSHVHAGFAVDTPRGLMVPVVRFADSMSLRRLSEEADRLIAGCVAGNINPDELAGGTFTVTNLGALGVEMFTPILNHPQAAILGVCSIQPRPVMNGDSVEFFPHIGLSLTINHQVIDGWPAAQYLKHLVDLVANFDIALAG